MYAGQQSSGGGGGSGNQNELNSNLLKSQLAASVHSRSQSLSGLQPVIIFEDSSFTVMRRYNLLFWASKTTAEKQRIFLQQD